MIVLPEALTTRFLRQNTHEKVRRRALGLIVEWTGDFESDPSLGIMEECYQSLKSKGKSFLSMLYIYPAPHPTALTGYKFDAPNDPPPPDADDALRRREEEELQRVLEMSMHDKGGRGQWSEYSLTSSGGAGSSGPASNRAAVPASATPSVSSAHPPQAQKPVYGGYVPASSPAVSAENTSATVAAASAAAAVAPAAPAPSVTPQVAASPAPSVKSQDSVSIVTRVRALHAFEPTDAGELAFEKGDIIKVVDRGYKDWWRGQLKGRTGIFPVNYVVREDDSVASQYLGVLMLLRRNPSRSQQPRNLRKKLRKRRLYLVKQQMWIDCFRCYDRLTLRRIILLTTRRYRYVSRRIECSTFHNICRRTCTGHV